METFELKYFLAVAKSENVHKASKVLNISPSAVSKALSRVEAKLETKLFEKVGRNIKITSAGEQFVKDASEMLALEKRIVESYGPNEQQVFLRIIGSELPLSHWSPAIIKKIQNKYENMDFSLEISENQKSLEMIKDFSADLAIITSPSNIKDKAYKKLAEIEFKVFTSPNHRVAKKKEVHVKDLVNEKFIVTESDFLGLAPNQANDGWRDDKFKRKHIIRTKSLKCLESLLSEGIAVSYLPEYYGASLGLKQLKVSGCPYSCKQKIYLVKGKYSLDSIWSLI